MKIAIHYQTQYAYAEPVSFSLHLFRLFPKADRHLSIRKVTFQTNADAVVSYRRDLFDNEIASVFYPSQSAQLSAQLSLELEVEERNAFGFLLDSHALEVPFPYKPEEQRVLAPFCSTHTPVTLPFWSPPPTPQATIATLVDLNRALHENLIYERREEGDPRSPAETIAMGRGACRDFAVLMAATLQGMGLAARVVSGYLCEFDEAKKHAEGALHAWTETYLPGAGWIGFDPTNGILCNHNHIPTAVGLSAPDIAPILGRYFHKTHVPALMTASLQIHEIA
jgi:transglutaminase-like putative cysteine protease